MEIPINREDIEKNAYKIKTLNEELDEAISGLDQQLDTKLKKQEHDYLKGYSMYVKQKEQDLRKIIAELNKNNEGNTQKEERIQALKNTIKRINDEQIRTE